MFIAIPLGESEACLQLLAVDDEIVEDTELFTVIFKAVNPNDIVNETTSVIVYDNDGKDDHRSTQCIKVIEVY